MALSGWPKISAEYDKVALLIRTGLFFSVAIALLKADITSDIPPAVPFMVNVTCSFFPLNRLDNGLPGLYFSVMNLIPLKSGWEISVEGIRTAVICAAKVWEPKLENKIVIRIAEK